MIWNLLDDFKVKAIFNKFLPHLAVAKKIQVPKLDTTITLGNIENLPTLENWKDLSSEGKYLESNDINWQTHS
jgi:hypothetical protein